jgi:hypothetical protein
MHSEFTRAPGQSFREEASGSLDANGMQRPSAAIGIVEEESEPRTGMCMVAIVQDETENAASAENLDTSLSVLDLVPASTEFGTQQVESRLTSNPSAAQSDCAADLAATMGRLLAAAYSTPGSQRKFSKSSSEYSPALTCIHPPSISAGMGSGVSTKLRLSARKAMAAAKVVLRQWKLGFKHDWKLTVTALNFPRMKKSIRHWLQQPLSPKPMTSSKNQTV